MNGTEVLLAYTYQELIPLIFPIVLKEKARPAGTDREEIKQKY